MYMDAFGISMIIVSRLQNQKQLAFEEDIMEIREVELVDDTEEEEVEEELTPERISQAVLQGSDWTVETILSQLRRRNIDMPIFQRRDAWARKRKSRYIESLLLRLPVPQIMLAERKERRGSFMVLDGKQRLLSLMQFIGLDEGSENNRFRLQGLEVLTHLNRRTYKDLQENPELLQMLDQFNNEPVRTVVVRNWPSNSFLHLLFVRLNSETLPLSPQELRQALFPGKFVVYIDKASYENTAIKQLLRTRGPDKRMRDVEILVRYIAFACFLSLHTGSLKGFLDDTCETLNREWATREEEIKERLTSFDYAVDVGMKVFGSDYIGRKWDEEGYFSSRLNKAILDAQLFYFSNERIGERALEKKEEVVKGYKLLSLSSEEFRNSIEFTTKSITATHTRLALWGESLKRALDMEFSIPTLEDNRMKFDGF